MCPSHQPTEPARMNRDTFNRRGLFSLAALTMLSPKKTLGLKKDMKEFKNGDVVTADTLNEMVKRINER